jgi:site-specific DNA-methyltransferase (adenine-specific)
MLNKIHHGDCLNILPQLADESIDAIITDPPYGVSGHTDKNGWDNIIPFKPLWAELERVIKPKGAIILFANQPFTTDLIQSNRKLFKYQWIWIKSKPTGFINAQNAPLRSYEDICVFSKGTTANKSPNRMNYYPQGLIEINKFKKSKNDEGDVWGARPSRDNAGYIQKFSNYPRNILYYSSVTKPIHPTEKPLDLLQNLIQTYTKERDTVLDFSSGSGSLAHASILENRNFICIERDELWYNRSIMRIEALRQEIKL